MCKQELAQTSAMKDDEIKAMLPIRMVSKVVRGFGRGSKDLGIPTANLDLGDDTIQCSSTVTDLPTGIYWGYGNIQNTTYPAAISIGYNPTYGNETKTVEPHLIAAADDPRRRASKTQETLLQDFYDQTIRLSVVGYLRAELPFEGLEKLVEAIKNDIVDSERLCSSSSSEVSLKEQEWVSGNKSVSDD